MDVTAVNIGLSRNEFLANLVASRLIAPGDLELLTRERPDEDALSLANALVTQGALTDFQLDAIVRGKPGEVRLGNYDILDRLGAGGMGTVFKARHRRMKRIVAVKVLSAEFCKDTAFVQRFQREVEVIARLGHPNVVMAYDADEAEIGHFLVMEFVNGRDLNSFVNKNHPLAPAVAVNCVVQAARGLAYAHSQGVVHRDIKPANLLRDTNGLVKVTDLGLARLNSGDREASVARGLTQTGWILGTVDYMAPEQAVDSTSADRRADIYSLGATLHFLLTGEPPFIGSTSLAVLLKHRDDPIPSLRAKRPDVPPELDAVFQRMMAKQTSNRYQSMAEVIAALEAISGLAGGEMSSTGAATVVTTGTPTVLTPRPGSPGVVIVEPSRVQSGIIRKYLESQDVIPTATAASGAAALAAVREHRPDAVVTALHLPDTTGPELVKQLRAEFHDRPPGFVLISSEAEKAEVSGLSSLDRVFVLSKPFTPEQLVQALNLVTGKPVAVKVANVPVSVVTPQSSVAISLWPVARDRATMRVLLVDDSAAARTHERIVLQGLGFTNITEVADGAQALAAATREPFDLIVTDYNMPLIDGFALISYLKNMPSLAAIPIVMVTTETSPAILDPVRKLGVAAIFDKMFAAADVKQLLDKLFG
ncbi:MAG: response regulator [Gemmataceae bacterium]